ncbi:MAG: tRNA dihydrouridine synthase DusB [Clostridia bacterium]|nr:tRNA dihydrouridine synthase DusB [Clostridia bacterium]
MMRIGKTEVAPGAALAPMAGVADRAFRRVCMQQGAVLCVSEMVSCKGLTFGDRKSAALMQLDACARPAGVQLFGDDPDVMAAAAELVMQVQPDFIDINMGCPAPKIAGNRCGSALMRQPELCRRIVAAVTAAVPVPVTVKMRKGYSAETANAVEVALACQAGGAAAVTVHGRTREQMYAPPADWECIRQVKAALDIPVIGNGDVTSAAAAQRMLRQTGCDLVMVGRAALGNPWIFAEIRAALTEQPAPPVPTVEQRMDMLCRQVELAAAEKGQRTALREARKHASWYVRGLRGAAYLRGQAGTLETMADLYAFCRRVEQMQKEENADACD